MRRRFAVPLIAIGLIFVALPASPQVDSGVITGRVSDAQGLPMPGVSVTARAPELIGGRILTTDPEGRYRFLALPPGHYEVTAELQGFAPAKLSDLFVRVGATLTGNFVLNPASRKEEVTVSDAAPIVDVEAPERRLNIDGDFMRRLPLSSRKEWTEAWFMVPGASIGGATSRFDPEIHGSGSASGISRNVYKLDGSDIANAYTGQGWTTQFSTEAIQDIEVKTAGFDAATPLGRGGFINVATKSGGNEFHGSATMAYQPKRFNDTNVPQGTPLDQVLYQPDVSLGGPIKRDRTWFYVSYRRVFINEGVPRTSADIANFRANSVTVPDFVKTFRDNRLIAKVTHQFNSKHNLTFSYLNDSGVTNNSDARPQSLVESTIRIKTGGPIYQGRWQSILDPRTLLNVQYNFRNTDSDTRANGGDAPAITRYARTRIGTGGNLTGDTVLLYSGNRAGLAWWSLGSRSKHEVLADFTRLFDWRGSHQFRTGLFLQPRTYVDWGNFYGRPGEPARIDEAPINPSVPGSPITPFYKVIYEPNEVTAFHGKGRDVGWYIQDRWSPWERLSLSAGLRIDNLKSWDQFDSARVDTTSFGPRFGATYALDRASKSVLRTTWGRIHESIFIGNAATTAGGSRQPGRIEMWDNNRDGVLETVLVTPAVLTQQPNATRLQGDIKPPYMDELTLGYTRQLGLGITLDASYIRRKYANEIESRDVNVVYENGRFVGYRNPDFNMILEAANTTENWTVYHGLEFSVVKNFSNNWQVISSYTYQHKAAHGNWRPDDINRYFHPAEWFRDDYLARPHLVRLNGTYRFPADLNLAVMYSAESGTATGAVITRLAAPDPAFGPSQIRLPNGRLVANPLSETRRFVGPRSEGQKRTPMIHTLNLRLSKGFDFGGRRRLELILDGFNVTNNDSPRFWFAGANDLTSPRHLMPSSTLQAPRAAQVSARFEF